MALFNMLRGFIPCPNCGQSYEREVQFRYGRTWQLEVHIGDPIAWGDPSVGAPGHHRVIAAGWIDACPNCDFEGECDVTIEDDHVVAVRPWSELPDLVLGEDFEVTER